jgi:5'(3')-deoxyribonucleotidase
MSVKDYPDVQRVYIDLDGPVADFLRKMSECGLPGSEMKLLCGIYKKLDVTPGAIIGVRLLERLGFHTWFLTKIPDENPFSATDKILWVQQYFPRIAERIILSPDKGCVGTERDYLIDDHPEWANAHNFTGRVIKFDRDSMESDTLQSWKDTLKCMIRDRAPRGNPTSFVHQLALAGATADSWKVLDDKDHEPYVSVEAMPGLTDEEFEYYNGSKLLPDAVWNDVKILYELQQEVWAET